MRVNQKFGWFLLSLMFGPFTSSLSAAAQVKRACLLKSGESLPMKIVAEGKAYCTVPVLNDYDVLLFEY